MSNIVSQDYQLVEEVLTDGEIPVSFYINKITGLKIVIAYVENPIVKGDIVLATEAHDDDGLPHTLEHLIFLGSESYPYKGILDLLANKCLADGTNALTDTDYTDYTLSTAGCDGFLNLLPIYLDHVLFPTLTDSGYITEVHHVDGNAQDAGTVYCEMQARENSGDSRCNLEMLRSLYPGDCGYKYETGGLLENFRNSTNNSKVRDYHKQFYHSKNLCIVITGPIHANEVFKTIKPIEDKIIQKGLDKIDFQRPWQTPVQPLPESVNRKIQYPSDNDDDGLVYIAFRGPNIVKDYNQLVAISILLDYLNSTPISPIQRDFVECPEPYCSSVSHNIIENSTSCFYLTFESVGKEYFDSVAKKLFDLLRKIQTGKENLDMDRLHTILSRKIVKILSTAETSPHAIIAGPVIGFFLYGTNDLKNRCQEIPILQEFFKLDSKFWLDLLDKYFVGDDSRYVCIVGEPSPELMQVMSDSEKERLSKQKETLKDKLPELAEKLKLAVELNEKPAPISVLNCVAVPSPDNIILHPIERVLLDKSKTPFRIQYDSIKTNFVTINMLLNTSESITKTDRLYLPILSEIILECPIIRDGQMLSYEKVVAELFRDTIYYCSGVGLSSNSSYSVGLMSMLFSIVMQVEISNYEKAVQWYRELLYQSVFTQDRIKTIATRMASEISQYKRSGGKVASSTLNGITYQSNSNQWATNFMRQQKFLKKLIKQLNNDPQSIEKEMTRIRDLLIKPNNIFVHITLNNKKIDVSKVHKPWLKLIPADILNSNNYEHIQLSSIIPCYKLVQPISQPKAAIVGVGSAESNYMYQVTKSINNSKHPDLPALYVLIQYLTQLEGPLWRNIRGLGLSYGYSIHVAPSEGLIYLLLSKSTQVVAAYNKATEIVERHLSGEEEFVDTLFESAKSSLIFELIKREKSAADKSIQSLLAYLRDLDIDFNKDLIKRVVQVTKDDLRRVGPLYLKPLFNDAERLTVVCCHPSKIEDLTKDFGKANCHLKKINFDEEKFLNSIE